MKLLKNIFLVFWLLILIFFLISCDGDSSSQNQEQIQQLQNIYFDYPVRDYPIGKSESSELYWTCSDNDFCDSYNGVFHSGEDWNLKGGRNDIDEGRPVYSIGEGKVIYAKEEEVGFRVVIEHTGTCVVPSKKNIKGSDINYEEEVLDKIYSVYLHLKDVQVSVGDRVGINDVIGKIKRYKIDIPPHLHFEIRKEKEIISDSYFENIQQIIDLGFRDPSEFIEANKIGNKVIIGSPQTISEESFSIETETISEETSEGTVVDDTLKIAYLSSDNELRFKSDIYTMDIDGLNKINLTNNALENSKPIFSPDGSKILFKSYQRDNFDIFLINIDGTDLLNLTDSSTSEYHPIFSPDGNKIAFQMVNENALSSDIYLKDILSSNQVNLTNNKIAGEPITFTPDGSKIIFTQQDPDNIGNEDPDPDIYIMNSNGSNQVNLTNNAVDYVSDVILSPDGLKIVFTTSELPDPGMYIMNIDGSNLKRLTDISGWKFAPSFSPDGLKIIFIAWEDEPSIYIININGSNLKRLTGPSGWENSPIFSPDGRKIVFSSNRDGNQEIYIMNADGTEPHRLTYNSEYYDDFPVFN